MALSLAGTCRLLALGLWSVAAFAGTPEDARRAYDAGHFTDALGIWAQLSRQGNVEAAFGLGLLYDLGNGTREDPEAAFFWYKVAADGGVPAAEFNVAAMYDSGRGVTADKANAALWFAKAAAHGSHRAQYALGMLYEAGKGVPSNPEAAAAWYRVAKLGGLSAAGARLKALASTPSPHAGLVGAALISPPPGTTIPIMNNNPAVVVVWNAPREAEPVHYEVELKAITGGWNQTVSSAETATVIALTDKADHYLLRVNTVGKESARVVGAWSYFATTSTAPLPRELTDALKLPHDNK